MAAMIIASTNILPSTNLKTCWNIHTKQVLQTA